MAPPWGKFLYGGKGGPLRKVVILGGSAPPPWRFASDGPARHVYAADIYVHLHLTRASSRPYQVAGEKPRLEAFRRLAPVSLIQHWNSLVLPPASAQPHPSLSQESLPERPRRPELAVGGRSVGSPCQFSSDDGGETIDDSTDGGASVSAAGGCASSSTLPCGMR